MRLAASIVTFRTPPQELRQALATLSESCAERITVVDHSGNDDLAPTVAQYPRAEYIRHENRGYGSGHNVALRQSLADGFDIHLVINSDVEIAPADIDRMAGYMDVNTDIGALHPRMLNSDGSPQYTVRLIPTPLDLILRRFLPKWIARRRRQRYELRHIDHTRPFNAPYMQGSFMMMSCDALRRVGLFDERFFLYPEDIDMSRRLHRESTTLYYPYATAVHHHRAASYHNLRMLGIHVVNMIRYFNKWGWISDDERRRFNAPLLKNR
ncbi:MAG: glycosyltransferase family 2 protein [Paramuribaculum sp.]|nr:glycosyltransferase family 2 protein [Paramuribaculum sp.]